MLDLSRIMGDERLMRATIGMPLSQFKGLLPKFEEVYLDSQLEYRPMNFQSSQLGIFGWNQFSPAQVQVTTISNGNIKVMNAASLFSSITDSWGTTTTDLIINYL
jgi:hypothetical protein